MFIKTFKTSKTELVIMLIGILCFIATLWYIITSASYGKTRNTSAVPSEKTEHFLTNARTADDRVKFLAQFGWEVEPDPLDVREVVIPAEFDELYSGYNDIQKKLGFDLEKYKGCRVKKTILIRDGMVIGGDISAGGGEQFIHSLRLMPSKRGGSVSAGDRN